MTEESHCSRVSISNCKNFDLATFDIESNKLNIKYAPNGTGKSSIADGIRYAIKEEPELGERIVPFKFRDDPNAHPFSCEGLEEYRSIEVFDESYVNDVVFVQNGIFASSFDVFIKTPEYKTTLERISGILARVQQCLKTDALINFRNSLGVFTANISGNSGLTSKMALRGTAPVKKGLSNGNPKTNIPPKYENFRTYICSSRLSQWSKWHASGYKILIESDTQCPFCGQPLEGTKDLIEGIQDDFVPANADNLDKVSTGIAAAKDYLSEETFNALDSIASTSEPLSKTQENYFAEVVRQADVISANMQRAENLNSYFNLAKLGENISKAIADCTIDLSLLSHFDSQGSRRNISEYNAALDEAQQEARILLGIINKQKKKLAEALAGYEAEINSFFSGAGYPYSIRITVDDDERCNVLLVHSSEYQISNANGILSYGERNALALIFFMYSALSSKPDLIILDDPITSFDGRKRFAILHMLFLKNGSSPNCLKNKTVILLTHEYEVVFDIEHTLKAEFQPLAKTTLLHISNGQIAETAIGHDDMKPIRALFRDIAQNSDLPIVQLAYARKLLELDNEKTEAWHYLSSLFHHKPFPSYQDGERLDGDATRSALDEIRSLTGFEPDYDKLLSQIDDKAAMHDLFETCEYKYGRLQIARIALDGEGIDRVSKKLLDETLHVDNGFIFQLDPRQFELIPDSIIERCEKALR